MNSGQAQSKKVYDVNDIIPELHANLIESLEAGDWWQVLSKSWRAHWDEDLPYVLGKVRIEKRLFTTTGDWWKDRKKHGFIDFPDDSDATPGPERSWFELCAVGEVTTTTGQKFEVMSKINVEYGCSITELEQ